MTEYYKAHSRLYVGVDCIIFGLIEGRLSILLVKRRFNPGMGCWSLMGGFVEEDESVDTAAKRVLAQLTGLSDVYMEQVGAFGEIARDPGERVVSIAYYALVGYGDYDAARIEAHNAHWIPLDEMPQLLFDHRDMVEMALERLRRKVVTAPVGFNLLPGRFTLSQLQSLYETILGEPLDKRNFRKRIAETGCIEKTGDIDKSGSRRGAALYQFNESVYRTDKKFKI